MEARKISVKLRRDPRETAERHSQANPLTLECTLATGEAVTETMELRAELHAAQTPATTPLAATAAVTMTAASTGPWDLVFSGAQMNQTVLPDSSTDFWLVIYATDADDNLFTLGKIALTLTFDNVSQVTPPPPEPPLYATFAFRTFAVAGQSSVVAETTADTLTLVAGSNITITTNATTDTITIASTGGGGGGGDVTGPASSTDNAITRFDGTTGKLIQSSTATLSDTGGIAADTLAISTTPTGAGGTGIFRYDTGEKVPEVGIDGITLKIGVQEYVRVYNSTASTLTKGQIVYINGAQGNRVSVALSDASSESTSAGTIGFVAQSITAGAEGFVQTSGPIYSLNTIGLTAGALLFLSETAGEWTTTEPAAPAHGVRLGYVERVHATVGSVFIKIDNGYELGELHNVSDGVTGAIAFLVKNAITNVWESKNAADSRTAMGAGTGNGTVTAVSVATANGVSGTSSGGATPALTITLGAITPSSVNGVTFTNGGSGALTVTGTASIAGASSGTNTGDQTITLTGDVKGSGTGSFAATIAASAVTYAKMQAVSAASRLLGRGTAGATAVREISLGTGLSMSGDVLSVTVGEISGTSGTTDNGIVRADGTSGSAVQGSSIVIDDIDTTTQQNVAIRNVDPATNSAIVLTPKGSGAFIVGPKPDGATTGGNARGANAVDLQTSRSNVAHVASGATAAVLGGNGNAATATNSATIAGLATQATAAQAVAHGTRATANRINMMAHGNAAASGECQRGAVVMRRTTTDATPVPLSMDGAAPTGSTITTSTHFILANNQAVFADIRVVARSASGTDHAAYMRRVLIKRDANAASTAIIGTVLSPTADIESAGATGWNVDVTALATSTEGGLLITVTGAAATTIVWGASVEFMEIIRA